MIKQKLFPRFRARTFSHTSNEQIKFKFISFAARVKLRARRLGNFVARNCNKNPNVSPCLQIELLPPFYRENFAQNTTFVSQPHKSSYVQVKS